jgi:hypothetical protein
MKPTVKRKTIPKLRTLMEAKKDLKNKIILTLGPLELEKLKPKKKPAHKFLHTARQTPVSSPIIPPIQNFHLKSTTSEMPTIKTQWPLSNLRQSSKNLSTTTANMTTRFESFKTDTSFGNKSAGARKGSLEKLLKKKNVNLSFNRIWEDACKENHGLVIDCGVNADF